MKARIIPIGNSRGVRIPKAMLQQSGLADEVDLAAGEGQIVIRRLSRPRADWEERIRDAIREGDEGLLDGDATLAQSSWDDAEWEW